MKHDSGGDRGDRVRNLLRGVLAVLMLGASLYSLAGATAAADPLIAQTPTPKTQPRIGRSNAQATVPLSVALKPVDENALNTFLAQLSDPQSPQYHKYLTPRQFTDRFFAPADRAQVVSFLTGKGLTVTDTGVGALVDASGSVANVERAFSVALSDYRDTDGRVFRAGDRTPALPGSVAAKITGVVGLDNSARPVSRLARRPVPTSSGGGGNSAAPRAQSPHAATGCAAGLTTAAVGGYTPNQLATAYNFDGLYTSGYRGEGESIALFELDDYADENVAAYQSCFGSSVDVRRVPVDGGAVLGQFPFGQAEAELDIDVIVGMAPRLSHLYVYSSPINDLNTETLRQYQRIADDNFASIVSTSIGGCEQDDTSAFRNAENTIFRQMAAQGQTIFDAIGDSGSQSCLATSGYNGIVADSVGSQPWVTGVGGTTLTLDPATNAYTSERVWNNFAQFGGGATGGGISQFWARPDWQAGPGVINAYSDGKRESPDVSANADPQTGYIFYTEDAASCPFYTGNPSATTCFEIVGGTSASAPLWAAATALTNQVMTANGVGRLGFANPTIYALFRAQPTLFHDVTQGDNCDSAACFVAGSAPGTGIFPATPGYDMTTGVGTLDAGRFARAVFGGRPEITGMNINSGPTDGGNLVTFTGSGFGTGMTVTFGNIPAQYTLNSFNQIVVVAPPHDSAEVTITVTLANGLAATAPHTYAYVSRTPSMHATVPVPTPRSPFPDAPATVTTSGPIGQFAPPATVAPPPTTVPHLTIPNAGGGNPVVPLPHLAAPTVLPATGTPNPAPARH